MIKRITTLYVLLLSFLLTGCTSVKPLTQPNLEELKLDDLAIVYQFSGRVSKIQVTEITEIAIKGTLISGAGPRIRVNGAKPSVTINRASIRSIEIEKFDILKTAGAGVGGTVAAAGVAYGFGWVIANFYAALLGY